MTTLREHLEAIRDRELSYMLRRQEHVDDAVAALRILDEAEHAHLIIGRRRGPWRLVRDPERSS